MLVKSETFIVKTLWQLFYLHDKEIKKPGKESRVDHQWRGIFQLKKPNGKQGTHFRVVHNFSSSWQKFLSSRIVIIECQSNPSKGGSGDMPPRKCLHLKSPET